MKSPRSQMYAKAGIGIAILLAITTCIWFESHSLIGAPASPESALTTDSFLSFDKRWRPTISTNTEVETLRDQLKRLTIQGKTYYLAEGDMLLDEVSFLVYARERLGLTNDALSEMPNYYRKSKPGQVESFISGLEINGQPVKWSIPNLSYCVRKNTFANESQYNAVVQNMLLATTAWSSVCKIKFDYVPKYDIGLFPIDPDDGSPKPITFIVQGINVGGQFVASSFFPNDHGYRRKILIDPSYFQADMGYDPTGVLRHELGHVLGFVHEHIMSGAPPICPHDIPPGKPFALTDYDPHSVMHYFCGGVGTKDLNLTDKDRIGATKLYH